MSFGLELNRVLWFYFRYLGRVSVVGSKNGNRICYICFIKILLGFVIHMHAVVRSINVLYYGGSDVRLLFE